MRARLVLAIAMTMAATLAAADEQYFIVRDTNAETCHIEKGRPANAGMIVGSRIYTSRADAESDIKTVCNGP